MAYLRFSKLVLPVRLLCKVTSIKESVRLATSWLTVTSRGVQLETGKLLAYQSFSSSSTTVNAFGITASPSVQVLLVLLVRYVLVVLRIHTVLATQNNDALKKSLHSGSSRSTVCRYKYSYYKVLVLLVFVQYFVQVFILKYAHMGSTKYEYRTVFIGC